MTDEQLRPLRIIEDRKNPIADEARELVAASFRGAMTKQGLHELAEGWAQQGHYSNSQFRELAIAYLRHEAALQEIVACDEGRLCECRDIAERALAERG